MSDLPEMPNESVENVIFDDGRYPPEAFAFLRDGMAKAVQNVHGAEAALGEQHHVTGQEICHALRDLAIERWGPLAKTVLAKWNVHGTIDFGNMVYLLIEHNFMHRREDDSIDDFRDVFDFDEALQGETEFEIKE